jgi:hypothetical protein
MGPNKGGWFSDHDIDHSLGRAPSGPKPDPARQAALEMNEAIAPLREWAKGFRVALLRDGWSQTQAEHIAAEALIDMIRGALGGAK